MSIETRLRTLLGEGLLELPPPGQGQTAFRLRRLAEIARSSLCLARLAEAHVDAVAIIEEADQRPRPGLYGVWAAETRGQSLNMVYKHGSPVLTGTKMFCSGATMVDRALVTVMAPEPLLVDVDLRCVGGRIHFDHSQWNTSAFSETQTVTARFFDTPVKSDDVLGGAEWYVSRPGFWHGACGPAACWAGGAMGLFDYANAQQRDDPHTAAHLGAMAANVWGLWAYLEKAGDEIDSDADNLDRARARALSMRHLVEQACTDMLRRLGRGYGPRPLAFDFEVSKRYQELDLYIRQCHAERDLEQLGRLTTSAQRL